MVFKSRTTLKLRTRDAPDGESKYHIAVAPKLRDSGLEHLTRERLSKNVYTYLYFIDH